MSYSYYDLMDDMNYFYNTSRARAQGQVYFLDMEVVNSSSKCTTFS